MKAKSKVTIRNNRSQMIPAFIVAFAVAGIGIKLLLGSHAATPSTAAGEAESGTKAGTTSVVADTSASGGNALQFGTVASGGGGTSPSGQAMPTGNLTMSNSLGSHTYTPIFKDDFTVDAATGSWGTSDAGAILYKNSSNNNAGWYEYPDGWSATYTNGAVGYEPSQVLSVHDGQLDFYLHTWNGHPVGANPSPNAGTSGNYQTYGAYSFRIKVSNTMSDFYSAWLLWPQDESKWCQAESDFPEANLGSLNGFSVFAHNQCNSSGGNGGQDYFGSSTNMAAWHTYTETWGPGYRSYYVDGSLIGTSTTNVYNNLERWQLQTEPSGSSSGSSGHIYVDWAVVYKY